MRIDNRKNFGESQHLKKIWYMTWCISLSWTLSPIPRTKSWSRLRAKLRMCLDSDPLKQDQQKNGSGKFRKVCGNLSKEQMPGTWIHNGIYLLKCERTHFGKGAFLYDECFAHYNACLCRWFVIRIYALVDTFGYLYIEIINRTWRHASDLYLYYLSMKVFVKLRLSHKNVFISKIDRSSR